jgi:ankyrin repeat protein
MIRASDPGDRNMDPRFHPAQAALAAGELQALAKLFTADPDLATARSSQSHPTLLQCLVLTMPPVDNLEALIDFLVDHGAEISGPLIAAAGINSVRAIAKLLDRGACIDGNGHWSPLEEALYFGNPDSVSLLLSRGAPVANLRSAAALGDMKKVESYFDETGALTSAAGAVEWPFRPSAISEHDRRDPRQILNNAFVHAAAWGRGEVVEFLLARGAEVNLIPAGFDYSGTALHYAAFGGHRAMVDQLLRHGADPAILDTKIGKLPEDWAEHSRHLELAEYLRRVRGRPGTPGGEPDLN